MESELPDIEDEYKRLLYLHRRLFELKEPEADSSKSFLSMKTPLNSACRLPRKNISSIKMVHKPYKIAICLPPKCGTTNWQKAMNVLEKDAKHKPPPSGEKYWKPEEFGYPDVYNILRNADITDKKDSKMISGWTKILNTRIGSLKTQFGISVLIQTGTIQRNPFTRLYSAWNDKSRTHRFQNGSILPEGQGLNFFKHKVFNLAF